jgi:hypothetical protein
LTNLHRFDEALAMYENLVREFPNLSDDERKRVEAEMVKLRGRVGFVDVRVFEPGTTLLIDGKKRGTLPLSAPIRVSSGSHVVRLYKDGFAPFEARLDVAGGQTVPVEATMSALKQSGGAKIAERRGRPASVVVDGTVVGTAPWDGTLSPGKHSVALAGDGKLGTQPATLPIRVNETTTLALELEPLEAELRIQPTPVNAVVALDGVEVGRGIWEGRVRAGNHRIEIAAEGFVASQRTIAVASGKHEVAPIELERDLNSPFWKKQNPSRFVFDLVLASALTPSFGGDLQSGCSGSCTVPLGVGGSAVVRAGYQFGSGLSLGLDIGWLVLFQKIKGRPADLVPQGLAPNHGTADDDLRLSGARIGASAAIRRVIGARPGGTRSGFLYSARLGVGAVIGDMRDTRTGTFTNNIVAGSYDVSPVAESLGLRYGYVAPELLIGHTLGEHFEIAIGAELLFLMAFSQPTWQDAHVVLAGKEGEARFGQQTVAGRFLLAPAPGLSLRFQL